MFPCDAEILSRCFLAPLEFTCFFRVTRHCHVLGVVLILRTRKEKFKKFFEHMENRLKAVREKAGLNLIELAKRSGFAVSTINNFENKKTDGSDRFIKTMAETLGVRIKEIVPDWEEKASGAIREGEDQPYGGGKLIMKTRHARRMVPVISWARAGRITERGFNYEDLENYFEETVETDSRDANAFALIVEGDSMAPEYRAGDRVVFAPNEEPRNGDIVVARLKDKGTVFFKRFKRVGPEGKKVLLESVNPDYGTLEFRRDEFWFIYPAVDMVRKIRR